MAPTRLALALTLFLCPAWLRGQEVAAPSVQSADASPAVVSEWLVQAVGNSCLVHDELKPAWLREIREEFGRPRRPLTKQEAEQLITSRPQRLEPSAVVDILKYFLTREPVVLRRSLPGLGRVEPQLVGELAQESHRWRSGFFDGFRARDDIFDWYGRTAAVSMGDGTALAVKLRNKNGGDDLQQEAEAMRRMPSMPQPIPDDEGRLERPFGTGTGIIYAAPQRSSAEGYFVYLNDKLPASLDRQERAMWLNHAAKRGVDQLIELRNNGYLHESLAAFSHSGTPWNWDYFRWEGFRFGPTAIHQWRDGFRYPNLRQNGLADLGHLVPVIGEDLTSESLGHYMGQNLTELALLILDSARVNRIPLKTAANIVLEQFHRYLEGLGLPWKTGEGRVRKSILATGRRLAIFKLASFMGLIDTVCLGKMPGWVVHPLAVRGVWPLVMEPEARILDFTTNIQLSDRVCLPIIWLFISNFFDFIFALFVSGFHLWGLRHPFYPWIGTFGAASLGMTGIYIGWRYLSSRLEGFAATAKKFDL